MEIELKKQDYEVKQTFVIPNLIQNTVKFIDKYANLYMITILCCIGYFGLTFFLGSQGGPFLWGALLVQPGHPLEVFRLVTSIFLHANFFHILINLLSLFAISKQLQNIWTKPQIFILFFLAGFIGNYLSFLTYLFLEKSIIAVGASGGLFGLLGSMVGFFLFHPGLSNVQRSIYIRQIMPILILNILIGLFVPQIALMVHIFGFLIGLIGGFILEKLPYSFTHYRPIFWSIVWIICILSILIFVVIASINYSHLLRTLPAYSIV